MLVEPLWVARGLCNAVASGETAEGSNMKFKKFITIMQAAMGIVPLNKRELLPPGRKLWRPPGWVKLRCAYELVCMKWMFVCLYVAVGLFKYKHLLYLYNIWILCTSIQNVANIARRIKHYLECMFLLCSPDGTSLHATAWACLLPLFTAQVIDAAFWLWLCYWSTADEWM